MNKNIVVFAGNYCTKAKEKEYFQLAYNLGKLLAQAKFTVVNGAGYGLMDQCLKGAFETGGKTIGIGFDIESRLHSKFAKKLKVFKDLKKRQAYMVSLADGFVVLPGGIGTLYEAIEIIALKRAKQFNANTPLIFLGKYYKPLMNFLNSMVKQGFLDKNSLKLFSFCENEKDAIKLLKNKLK
jgi:uncharacterized protein (TIGR00730 family)